VPQAVFAAVLVVGCYFRASITVIRQSHMEIQTSSDSTVLPLLHRKTTTPRKAITEITIIETKEGIAIICCAASAILSPL
jgi:hypothetical protein